MPHQRLHLPALMWDSASFHEDKAVGMLAEILAARCGVDPAKARQIRFAASLHDIGKRKLQHLVNKPSKLTDEEYEQMKAHTTIGAKMLERANLQGELGVMAMNIARWHHENWDGSGYFGEYLSELPYYVEMVAIADTFTALVCKRSYKDSWPPEEALAYIESLAAIRFSSALVAVFIPLVRSDSRVEAIFESVASTTSQPQ